MKIREVELAAIGRPPGMGQGGDGEFLSSPMDAIPRSAHNAEHFVGLRGGPAYAVLVRVHTDDGLSGVGSVGVGSGAAAYVIEHHLKPLLLGQNPFDVELLWEKMFRATLNYGRKGLVLEAISAIDIALWDIMGKVTGQPVYNLLGGKTREKIRVYASRLYANEDLDVLAAQAQMSGYVAVGPMQYGFVAVAGRFAWYIPLVRPGCGCGW